MLYETTKVGVNKTGEMLKNLTKLVGIDTAYTNHSVRATGIILLKEAGHSDRDICKLTGNKAITLVSNYEIKEVEVLKFPSSL